MSEKPGFMVYHELYESLSMLPLESVGKLLMAMLEFSISGVEPEFSDISLRVIWPSIRGNITRDAERYESVSMQRKYAIYARWAKQRNETILPYEEWQAEASVFRDDTNRTETAPKSMNDTTVFPVLRNIPTSTTNSTPASTTISTPTSDNIIEGSAEEKEGLGEKETTLSPADEFLSRHSDYENQDLVLMAAQIMRDRQQARLANISC